SATDRRRYRPRISATGPARRRRTHLGPPLRQGQRDPDAMKSHRIDLVALLLGLAFLMTGAGFIIHETTGRDFDPGAAAALGFIILGVVALVATLLRPKRELAGASTVSEAGIPPSSSGDKEL